ncbi:MAG TPA: hypothetical protein VMT70_24530 [Vicinamibacteria bacterium]|nr:hypothetical protein [Vicinamibacteria bacterium]
MRAPLSLLAAAVVAGLVAARPLRVLGEPPPPPAPALACRALEVHEDARLGLTIVVFHQRDDADQVRLATLLRGHEGAEVDFRTGDGASHAATLMRLKSCFGRGLLLFPTGGTRLHERDEFLLGEPKAEGH